MQNEKQKELTTAERDRMIAWLVNSLGKTHEQDRPRTIIKRRR